MGLGDKDMQAKILSRNTYVDYSSIMLKCSVFMRLIPQRFNVSHLAKEEI